MTYHSGMVCGTWQRADGLVSKLSKSKSIWVFAECDRPKAMALTSKDPPRHHRTPLDVPCPDKSESFLAAWELPIQFSPFTRCYSCAVACLYIHFFFSSNICYTSESWEACKNTSCVFHCQQLGSSCSLVELAVIRQAGSFQAWKNVWKETTHNGWNAPEVSGSRTLLFAYRIRGTWEGASEVFVRLFSIQKVWHKLLYTKTEDILLCCSVCGEIRITKFSA